MGSGQVLEWISLVVEQARHAKCGRGLSLCRAGWIAVRTTALCLRFDSPTLGPHFPIPRPIALLLGCITSHRVTSHRVRLHHLVSGHITSRQVASPHVGLCHIVSGRVASRQVVLHCVRSHHITLHRVTSHWVGSHHIGSGCIGSGWVSRTIIGSRCAIINPIWCAIPPCCYSPSCTLSSCSFCEGLAFTYMLPYLASVIAALGACP